MITIVERDINAKLGSGEEQALACGSSRTAFRNDVAGMPLAIGCQVLP